MTGRGLEQKGAGAGLGARDVLVVAALALLGAIYYGRYYDHGFNLGDEGSVLLITQRLIAGERPIADIKIGYGVLWYYPLVALFKATGVSLVAARLYFLSLALLTSLLTYVAVRGRTRWWWLGLTAALVVLVIPGTLHKTFIPLSIAANMLAISRIDFDRPVLPGRSILPAALLAALSWQIRGEVGLGVTSILAAGLTAHAISRSSRWGAACVQASRSVAPLVAAALLVSLPIALHAYADGFLGAYLRDLAAPLTRLVEFARLALTGSMLPDHTPAAIGVGQTLSRAPLSALRGDGPGRDLALLTYLPLLLPVAIAGWAAVRAAGRKRDARPLAGNDTVGALALAGVAYLAFPQFFFFRPDAAHLSQFMPGFVLLAALFAAAAFPGNRPRSPATRHYLAWSVLAAVLALHVAFYVSFGLRHPRTGSIALSHGREERFVAANGIDVAVTLAEKKLFESLVALTTENSGEGDVVLCFPYCPGLNVMANRRTFLRELYVDDSMLLRDPGWQGRLIREIESEEPPIIVVHDWALNGTEISRFVNWATDVMDHIHSSYSRRGVVGRWTFYAREPEKVRPDGAAGYSR